MLRRFMVNIIIIMVILVFSWLFRFPVERMGSESESELELFTGDTSKDNHSPGPVFREVSP